MNSKSSIKISDKQDYVRLDEHNLRLSS